MIAWRSYQNFWGHKVKGLDVALEPSWVSTHCHCWWFESLLLLARTGQVPDILSVPEARMWKALNQPEWGPATVKWKSPCKEPEREREREREGERVRSRGRLRAEQSQELLPEMSAKKRPPLTQLRLLSLLVRGPWPFGTDFGLMDTVRDLKCVITCQKPQQWKKQHANQDSMLLPEKHALEL